MSRSFSFPHFFCFIFIFYILGPTVLTLSFPPRFTKPDPRQKTISKGTDLQRGRKNHIDGDIQNMELGEKDAYGGDDRSKEWLEAERRSIGVARVSV